MNHFVESYFLIFLLSLCFFCSFLYLSYRTLKKRKCRLNNEGYYKDSKEKTKSKIELNKIWNQEKQKKTKKEEETAEEEEGTGTVSSFKVQGSVIGKKGKHFFYTKLNEGLEKIKEELGIVDKELRKIMHEEEKNLENLKNVKTQDELYEIVERGNVYDICLDEKNEKWKYNNNNNNSSSTSFSKEDMEQENLKEDQDQMNVANIKIHNRNKTINDNDNDMIDKNIKMKERKFSLEKVPPGEKKKRKETLEEIDKVEEKIKIEEKGKTREEKELVLETTSLKQLKSNEKKNEDIKKQINVNKNINKENEFLLKKKKDSRKEKEGKELQSNNTLLESTEPSEVSSFARDKNVYSMDEFVQNNVKHMVSKGKRNYILKKRSRNVNSHVGLYGLNESVNTKETIETENETEIEFMNEKRSKEEFEELPTMDLKTDSSKIYYEKKNSNIIKENEVERVYEKPTHHKNLSRRGSYNDNNIHKHMSYNNLHSNRFSVNENNSISSYAYGKGGSYHETPHSYNSRNFNTYKSKNSNKFIGSFGEYTGTNYRYKGINKSGGGGGGGSGGYYFTNSNKQKGVFGGSSGGSYGKPNFYSFSEYHGRDNYLNDNEYRSSGYGNKTSYSYNYGIRYYNNNNNNHAYKSGSTYNKNEKRMISNKDTGEFTFKREDKKGKSKDNEFILHKNGKRSIFKETAITTTINNNNASNNNSVHNINDTDKASNDNASTNDNLNTNDTINTNDPLSSQTLHNNNNNINNNDNMNGSSSNDAHINKYTSDENRLHKEKIINIKEGGPSFSKSSSNSNSNNKRVSIRTEEPENGKEILFHSQDKRNSERKSNNLFDLRNDMRCSMKEKHINNPKENNEYLFNFDPNETTVSTEHTFDKSEFQMKSKKSRNSSSSNNRGKSTVRNNILYEEAKYYEQPVLEKIKENIDRKADPNVDIYNERNLKRSIEGNIKSNDERNMESNIISNNLERNQEKNLERNIKNYVERNSERNLEKHMERNLERKVEGSIKSNVERNLERNMERNVERNLERNMERNIKNNDYGYTDINEEEIEEVITMEEGNIENLTEDRKLSKLSYEEKQQRKQLQPKEKCKSIALKKTNKKDTTLEVVKKMKKPDENEMKIKTSSNSNSNCNQKKEKKNVKKKNEVKKEDEKKEKEGRVAVVVEEEKKKKRIKEKIIKKESKEITDHVINTCNIHNESVLFESSNVIYEGKRVSSEGFTEESIPNRKSTNSPSSNVTVVDHQNIPIDSNEYPLIINNLNIRKKNTNGMTEKSGICIDDTRFGKVEEQKKEAGNIEALTQLQFVEYNPYRKVSTNNNSNDHMDNNYTEVSKDIGISEVGKGAGIIDSTNKLKISTNYEIHKKTEALMYQIMQSQKEEKEREEELKMIMRRNSLGINVEEEMQKKQREMNKWKHFTEEVHKHGKSYKLQNLEYDFFIQNEANKYHILQSDVQKDQEKKIQKMQSMHSKKSVYEPMKNKLNHQDIPPIDNKLEYGINYDEKGNLKYEQMMDMEEERFRVIGEERIMNQLQNKEEYKIYNDGTSYLNYQDRRRHSSILGEKKLRKEGLPSMENFNFANNEISTMNIIEMKKYYNMKKEAEDNNTYGISKQKTNTETMFNYSKEIENKNKDKNVNMIKKWKTQALKTNQNDDWLCSDILLSCFLNFIKLKKCVNIAELSRKFQTTPQDIREKLVILEEQDMINGILDDKGNYIYLSQEEINKLCYEVENQGKVNTHEDFVKLCNNVISLNVEDQNKEKLKEEEKIIKMRTQMFQ